MLDTLKEADVMGLTFDPQVSFSASFRSEEETCSSLQKLELGGIRENTPPSPS